MKLLTQNSKMKKSSNESVSVWNWTIPAYKAQDGTITCPNASKCVKGCYAKQGAYVWSNTQKSHNAKFQLTKSPDFVSMMIKEIESKRKRSKTVYIRIHDAGDFYSPEYTLRWFLIMNHFLGTNVKFYAYTKQVLMFKGLEKKIPHNFKLVFSYGGKQDKHINPDKDRHSWVFETESELENKGYINASSDDLLALTDNAKVGLVYHGTKSYRNTTWQNVKAV